MNFRKQRAEAIGKVQATVRDAAKPVTLIAVLGLVVALVALVVAWVRK